MQIRSYHFFSLVRDPVERFYSGYSEASWLEGSSKYPVSSAGMEMHLRRIADHSHCDENNHLVSQVIALGHASVAGGDAGMMRRTMSQVNHIAAPIEVVEPFGGRRSMQLPIDYLSSIDRMEEAMRDVLWRVGAANLQFDAEAIDRGHAPAEVIKGDLLKLRNSMLDGLILEAYAQDVACFGRLPYESSLSRRVRARSTSRSRRELRQLL